MSFPLIDVQSLSECSFDVQWTGSTAVVSCQGVIDMLSAPQFESQIEAALADEPSAIIVDLTGVTFLASHGMGVLVATQQRVTPQIAFSVVADGPVTLRPMTLIGLDSVLTIYPTVDAALAAAQA